MGKNVYLFEIGKNENGLFYKNKYKIVYENDQYVIVTENNIPRSINKHYSIGNKYFESFSIFISL